MEANRKGKKPDLLLIDGCTVFAKCERCKLIYTVRPVQFGVIYPKTSSPMTFTDIHTLHFSNNICRFQMKISGN